MAQRKSTRQRAPARTGRRAALKKSFLEHYALMGVVTWAAKKAGVDRTTVYGWAKDDPDFAAAWAEAEEEAKDGVRLEMRRRAIRGVDKPVFYKGKEVATTREYSDNLLRDIATAILPEHGRDKGAGDGDRDPDTRYL